MPSVFFIKREQIQSPQYPLTPADFYSKDKNREISQKLYEEQKLYAEFRLYKDVEHTVTKEMTADIITFF